MHLSHAVLLAGLCLGSSQGVTPPASQSPAEPAASPAPAQPVAAGDAEPAVAQPAAVAPMTSESSTAAPASADTAEHGSAPKPGKHKGKKEEYTGPTNIVELAPTPMLDEEGKQRLDPDGKPMFNLPVKQQRDKYGHPLFDEGGKAVMQTASELGYDEHGKKIHAEKIKPPKMVPVTISRGILSMDGMTAKAALNYDIPDLKYLYIFAPGVGTVVVSHEPFPGATAQQKAFSDKLLTVNVGEHVLQLASDTKLLGKDVHPAYVLVDRGFVLPSRSPVLGYGTLRKAPYAWPGAKPNSALAGVDVPPVPTNMLPTQLRKPCPAGQMRAAGPAVLPGQTATEQPCVSIPGAKGAQPAAAAPAVAVSSSDTK